MKKIAVILSSVIIFSLILTGCGPSSSSSSSSTSGTTQAPTKTTGESTPSTPIVGAFTEDRDVTAEDKAVFDEVMASDTTKTYELLKVATQVVSGTNYRFLANVTSGDSTYKALIFIYQPLPDSGEKPSFVSEERL